MKEYSGRAAVPFASEKLSPRSPLIYVHLGTVVNSHLKCEFPNYWASLRLER
jgi:hypothetical protein